VKRNGRDGVQELELHDWCLLVHAHSLESCVPAEAGLVSLKGFQQIPPEGRLIVEHLNDEALVIWVLVLEILERDFRLFSKTIPHTPLAKSFFQYRLEKLTVHILPPKREPLADYRTGREKKCSTSLWILRQSYWNVVPVVFGVNKHMSLGRVS